MANFQNQVEEWAEKCRNGRLCRRDFFHRVLAIGGSVPVALTALQEAGVSAAGVSVASLTTTPAHAAADHAGDIRHCSFCQKTETEVRKLIKGPNAFICNECVDAWNDIVFDELTFG